MLYYVNEIETFEDINVWMSEINQYGPKYEGDGSNFVIYLVGNKIDKLNNDDEEIGESNDENLYKPVTKKEKKMFLTMNIIVELGYNLFQLIILFLFIKNYILEL